MIDDPGAIAVLEASARAALPARLEVTAPGWVCRISGGRTKRVNSVNAAVPDARLDDVADLAARLYADHGLPLRYRLTPLAAASVDGALAMAGFAAIEPAWTMAMPLGDGTADDGVTIADGADAAWLDGLANLLGWGRDDRDCNATLMAAMPRGSLIAAICDGGQPIAFAAGGRVGDRLWLFHVAVVASLRGRGLGRRVVSGLLAAAAAMGIEEALLQVLTDNDPARRLYRSLGFVDAYPYHYRVAPSGE